MEKYNIDEVRNCYNLAAQEYSDKFSDELNGKPFDRDLLTRFAKSVTTNGKFLDLGTATGHIADYLYKQGLKNVIGVDIAEQALIVARQKYPYLKFENRNIFDTQLPDDSIDGIVCFYGIVHFTYKEISRAIGEWKRILKPGGKALFSFHIGEDDSLRVQNFLDKENAKATWNNFRVERIVALLNNNGIEYDEVIIRYPYTNKEHPSKRCYIQFSKKGIY
jgi:ubiquinone/menaquinone biosynthesis C-methylase UbiE